MRNGKNRKSEFACKFPCCHANNINRIFYVAGNSSCSKVARKLPYVKEKMFRATWPLSCVIFTFIGINFSKVLFFADLDLLHIAYNGFK